MVVDKKMADLMAARYWAMFANAEGLKCCPLHL